MKREDVIACDYDIALCHNFVDMAYLANCDVPKILLFHNKLSTELKLGGDTVPREKYLAGVSQSMERAAACVFVSESKKEDWGFDGTVIAPGLDADEFHHYDGSIDKILRVGDRLKERDVMLGYSAQEEICRGFDSEIAGFNPDVEGALPASSWDDLKIRYSSRRMYLSTTIWPWEDGYNLAMLEAMASGAPVVTLDNATSPVTDGEDGYRSGDIDYLRERVAELMSDRALAKRIGNRGKEKSLVMFSHAEFIRNWNGVFEMAATGGAR